MTIDSSYALWLYGSHARGNSDKFSDLDVLFVSSGEGNHCPMQDLSDFAASPSISRYSWREVERMAQYGSLFLRHVQLEGRRVRETGSAKGRLSTILSTLGPYQLATRDLVGFRTVLSDASESLRSGAASLFFEVSTIATVFRHASILGCSLSGTPCFSRIEPVSQVVSGWRLPKKWADEFPRLYQYRLYADGRVARVNPPSNSFAWTWCRRTRRLLEKLQQQVDE